MFTLFLSIYSYLLVHCMSLLFGWLNPWLYYLGVGWCSYMRWALWVMVLGLSWVWVWSGGSLSIFWWLMGGLTVLLLTLHFGPCVPVIWVGYYWLLTTDYWTSVPVIGLITPVIGLRSLWLDFGPCDWTTVPVIGFLPLRTWLLTGVGFGMMVGVRVWRLELGVLSWFMYSWVRCVYSVDILLFSLWLVGSFWLLFSWYLVYGFVVLYSRYWILALFGWVLVYDSFSLLLLSIRFGLLNSLLVFIFYMGV